jgi:hypothetical protein
MISVVVPTIPGREEMFGWVCAAYTSGDYAGNEVEVIVEHGHPTVGCAWQAGADKARGEYIHLGNDDCEPHPGWWQPAVQSCDEGFLPSPMVYTPAGYAQALPEWGKVAPDRTPVSCAMIPFLSRAQWEAVSPLLLSHYYSDNFITDRAVAAGFPCEVRTGYAFTHHWAQAGRGAGMTEMNRMIHDEALYARARDMVSAGTWSAPWPAGGTTEDPTASPGGGQVPRLEGDNIVKSWRHKGSGGHDA